MVWVFLNELCLFVLPGIQGTMFIQGATSIPNFRVLRYLATLKFVLL